MRNAKKRKSAIDFLIWVESKYAEECESNYKGSSRGMEVQGVLEMFRRFEELHGCKYANYIGDGDSKTFTNLLAANPYGDDFVVEKLECVNHVAKRMFIQLKEAKKILTQQRKAVKEKAKKAETEEQKNL